MAQCARGQFRQAVSILDLPLPTPPPDGAQGIDAYRHWADRPWAEPRHGRPRRAEARVGTVGMGNNKKAALPPRLQDWVDARKRHKLSHAQVQMARELGLNPKKLGGMDNHRQEP